MGIRLLLLVLASSLASVAPAAEVEGVGFDDTAQVAGAQTRVAIDGRPAGAIAGEDFYRALLRIWLGDKPVQEDLKKTLLGG